MVLLGSMPMSLLPLLDRRRRRRSPPTSHPAFPTLHQRIEVAREAARRGAPLADNPAPAGTIRFLIDHDVAKSILEEHELVVRDDIDDDEERDDGNEGDDDGHTAKLEKPTKATKLLRYALTNANGDDWTRQRQCVSRAFAVKNTIKEEYAGYAAEGALGMIREAIGKPNSVRLGGVRKPLSSMLGKFSRVGHDGVRDAHIAHNGVADVRIFAREVAVRTMCQIVLGEYNRDVADALRGMIRNDLSTRRDEVRSEKSRRVVERLDDAVRTMIDNLAANATARSVSWDERPLHDATSCPCLIERLLAHERTSFQNKDETGYFHYLTREEVIGNSHSALLAGTQTISTTLAGAMLHLAQHPELQIKMRDGTLSGHSVTNETLRILPPVASLPRKPTQCDLRVSKDAKDGHGGESHSSEVTGEVCPMINKGEVFVIDLLAFAHGHCGSEVAYTKETASTAMVGGQSALSSSSASKNVGSLQFDPISKRDTQARPWGMGKRRCPAGSISPECIAATLEAIVKEGIAWSFVATGDLSRKGESIRGGGGGKMNHVGEVDSGWTETVSYRPTLTYELPLFVQFYKFDNPVPSKTEENVVLANGTRENAVLKIIN